jgi:hypothetical protein
VLDTAMVETAAYCLERALAATCQQTGIPCGKGKLILEIGRRLK